MLFLTIGLRADRSTKIWTKIVYYLRSKGLRKSFRSVAMGKEQNGRYLKENQKKAVDEVITWRNPIGERVRARKVTEAYLVHASIQKRIGARATGLLGRNKALNESEEKVNVDTLIKFSDKGVPLKVLGENVQLLETGFVSTQTGVQY